MSSSPTKLLLDSDVITALGGMEGEYYDKAVHCLTRFPEPQLCIAMLTFYELEYSIAAASNQDIQNKIRQSIDSLKANLTVLNLGFEDAQIYGQLKQGFKQRTGINQKALKRHNIDIALASIAIANDCILVGQDGIYSDHLVHLDDRFQHQDWNI